MNPDDIKAVLLYLKSITRHNSAILKKLDLGYDELGVRKFTKFLLEKNLIEPDTDENPLALMTCLLLLVLVIFFYSIN